MNNWTAYFLTGALVLWALCGYVIAARDAVDEATAPVLLIVDYSEIVEESSRKD